MVFSRFRDVGIQYISGLTEQRKLCLLCGGAADRVFFLRLDLVLDSPVS
jgi:hypothetical protein